MVKTQDISSLKSSNYIAFSFLILPAILATAGMILSLKDDFTFYIVGQFILSLFFLQTFILLHECAHLNFFRNRSLNIVFGNIFGVFTLIPFYSWQHMHNLHHKWTGWRDKDPTTEKTVEPSKSPIMRIVANIAWWLFIPLFYLTYKISNYWNVFKIKRHLHPAKYKKAIIHICIYLSFYLSILLLFPEFILRVFALSFSISLIWKELVIMTQHSHIEIPISNGEKVKPVAYVEQVPFTRSFFINSTIARFLIFNFNLHEAHHMYPGLPAYWLDQIKVNEERKPTYIQWFKKAKSMKGEDYVFRTSKHTGEIF
jgi:fatty acid desaturase